MNFSILIFKRSYSYRFFVQLSLLIPLSCFLIISILNYLIDPMKMFQHQYSFNAKQLDFDERQQKTNYLKFAALPQNKNFESVLLGSSRSTYINQNYFEGLHVFNYAANNMSPYEYAPLIATFSSIMGKDPKNIILGIDFFGTAIEKNKIFRKENYSARVQDSAYRWTMLLNFKITEYSIRNIKQILNSTKPYYNRDNIKFLPNTSSFRSKNTNEIEQYLRKFKNYEFDKNLQNEYINLKNTYRNSNFIIYTSPVTINQLLDYEKNGYLEYYFQWLEELVSIFDEVYHFMYPNSITQDLTNFFDAEHIRPQTGQYIAKYIAQKEKFQDFGIILTKDNINQFKKEYRKYDSLPF